MADTTSKKKTNYVFVQNADGLPLAPTSDSAYVRILLKTHKAKIVMHAPFTIRLKDNHDIASRDCVGSFDPGRENIGLAIVDESKNDVVIDAHITTNNKEVTRHMKKRKAHRQTSRHGERKRRQRRARRNTTTFKEGKSRQRILPKCEEPITNNYIVNSESRFANRNVKEGHLTPTVETK